MANSQYITVLDILADIPDPRKDRGKRHPWWMILLLLVLGLLQGEETPYGIGMWVQANAERLEEALQPARGYLPSFSTLYRALRAMDIEEVKHKLGLNENGEGGLALQGVALDGKSIRGAWKFGESVHLLSLVRHDPPVILAQAEVGEKENEISAAPALLAEVDLRHKVVTADALLTQRALCEQILSQGSDYLLVVKDNQPRMKEAIAYLFDNPPWTQSEKNTEYQHYTTTDKGHGRIECRTLEASTSLNDYLDWPGLQQVMKRTTRRTIIRTGEVTEAVAYGITSLQPVKADAKILERLWRGHWAIENRVHYVRDVTMGEDAGRSHRDNTPVALAFLRNLVLSLLRLTGWDSIPNAFRYYRARLHESLQLLGYTPRTDGL
ncbi:MAG: ISAs1 family transposase [Chloroflexi bacterium]|nr:ISAs1 family transposase [Chloroflexota bacterium]